MTRYKIFIDRDALNDIQQLTDWYNEQLPGLGSRFQRQVKSQIKTLKSQPQRHQIRYADIRCCLVKKFPFLIHFSIDERRKLVEIFAVIHTSRNPKIWLQRATKK